MKYTVVQNVSLHKLIESVNHHIADGWQVLGGIAVAAGGFFAQAMIREEA